MDVRDSRPALPVCDRGRGMMGRTGEGDGGWRKGRQRKLHPWDGRSRWVEA